MNNLNLLFNKTYYEMIGRSKNVFDKDLKRKNEELFGTRFEDGDYLESPFEEGKEYGGRVFRRFFMKTVYPGLLVGTGYSHGSGLSDNDINLGFSFDYSSGQPYVPGSSVKGILHSCFKNGELIRAFLEDLGIGTADTKALENIIFGKTDTAGADIFLDAVIKRGNKDDLIVGSDSITPHGDDVTKDPTPLSMIKILPDVVMEFRFLLDKNDDILPPDKKAVLFRSILEFNGIGAKTNVGYGILSEADADTIAKKKRRSSPVNPESQKSGKPDCVVCPHCGKSNYKYYQDGNIRKKCFSCHDFLYPRR